MAHILIIDDDGALLMTVRAALMTKGHSVKQAKDGLDGLDFANKDAFDLIITDANMPGGVSGYQLVQNLRKTGAYQNVPIIFLTGRREKKDVIRALESGADDYVVKPIDYDLLLSKVDLLLKSGRVVPTANAPNSPSPSKGEGSANVQFAATWSLNVQIETLTETGLAIQSSFKVPIGFEIEIESTMFKEIGISAPKLTVIACLENPESGAGFTIETRFLEISKVDARRVADWVRAAAKKQSY